jgi:hypothetical protein
MNWGLMEDNQKFKISIPVGDLSSREVYEILKTFEGFAPGLFLMERRLKIDRIKEKMNEKKL